MLTKTAIPGRYEATDAWARRMTRPRLRALKAICAQPTLTPLAILPRDADVSLTSEIIGLMAAAIAMASLTACQRAGEPKEVASGRAVFMANCASCHNTNPNLAGSLGPPIAGSSRELVKARVLHASYPPGYKPKRNTHLMQPMPWLAPKIDDLTAFLDYAAAHYKK